MQGNQSVPTSNVPKIKDGRGLSHYLEAHFWGIDGRKPQRSWKEHRKTQYR